MLLSFIMTIVVVYVALVAGMFLLQHRLVYLPSHDLYSTPRDRGLVHEDLHITTSDSVRLHGWFVPAQQAQRTILFFHGNAGNISHRLDTLRIFHELGFNTLIIDYRGYGRSEGEPTEEGTYLDAIAAWEHLVEHRHLDPQDIIVHGRSLGGGVAAWLANARPVGALILESTFTSLPDLAQQLYWWLPAKMLTRIHYATKTRLADISCPVLVVHARDDEIIPVRHGEALHALAGEQKMLVLLDGGHNDGFLRSRETYTRAITDFASTSGAR